MKAEVLRLSNVIKQSNEALSNTEQYTRRVCVEIRGIPEEQDENTNELTIKVGSLMELNIQESDISVSHCLPQKRKNQTYLQD
jgi:exoribonuclease R